MTDSLSVRRDAILFEAVSPPPSSWSICLWVAAGRSENWDKLNSSSSLVNWSPLWVAAAAAGQLLLGC